jgi:hypothetical protein
MGVSAQGVIRGFAVACTHRNSAADANAGGTMHARGARQFLDGARTAAASGEASSEHCAWVVAKQLVPTSR